MGFHPVNFILLVLFAVTISVPAQWKRVEVDSLSWFHAVQFVDERTGWAGGSGGTLLRSTDAGQTWRKVKLPTADLVRDISFSDSANGWLLLERDRFARKGRENPSYLMRTADGGESWTRHEFQPGTEARTRIISRQDGSIFSIGEGGVIAGLSEKGFVERINLPTRYLFLSGSILGGSRLVIVGGGGSVLASDDLGKLWHTVVSGGGESGRKLNSLFFADDRNGWACGDDGDVIRSDNGGRTWRRMVSGVRTDLLDIRFVNIRSGFAIGENGVVLRSGDAGETWAADRPVTKHRLQRIAFAGKRAIVVGFGGTILTTDLETK